MLDRNVYVLENILFIKVISNLFCCVGFKVFKILLMIRKLFGIFLLLVLSSCFKLFKVVGVKLVSNFWSIFGVSMVSMGWGVFVFVFNFVIVVFKFFIMGVMCGMLKCVMERWIFVLDMVDFNCVWMN